jgi:GNAT superfamily N-acetyltransferase
MARQVEVFIVEDDEGAVGFYTLVRSSRTEAELPLIYLRLDRLRRGIGRWCFGRIEKWIPAHWPEVESLFLDTIIPGYNGPFYEKMGFVREGDASCDFRGRTVPAVRFRKRLAAGDR